MSAESQPVSKIAFWGGWVLTVLSGAGLLFSGAMKIANPPGLADGFNHLGWSPDLALGLGIVEIVCALIYLFPKTATLGAILLTGYVGGAIATHVRIGEPIWGAAILGVLIWLGLFLREPRLRAILPIR